MLPAATPSLLRFYGRDSPESMRARPALRDIFSAMSAWRRGAVEQLPEFREIIEQADRPMALWIEPHLRFEDAFRSGNDDLLRRFFSYADWCIDTAKPRPTDASTAAWCAFYEDLPL